MRAGTTPRVPALDDVRSVHLVGIGGTGMTPLATILLQKGVAVSGSDLVDPPSLQPVRALGARITQGHRAENLGAVDVVVVSSAVPTENPEVQAAVARGIPVMKHSAALGSLMRRRRGVAIAGTHGKTTTSALTAVALDHAGTDLTFHVGSELLNYGLFGRFGRGDLLVAEADEYDRRFLDYDPEVAVVTSVEPDHLDYFGDFDAVASAFEAFLARVRPGGAAILCADDPVARRLPTGAARRVTYGFAAGADWQVLSWAPRDPRGSRVEVRAPDGQTHRIHVNLLGRHNAANAVAAMAVCATLGVPREPIVDGLGAFAGTRRRFEVVGEMRGVTVVDDYAHHPTAIRVTLEAARAHYAGGLWVIFQPHTAHRTMSLLEEFARCFGTADHVIITPTYRPAGREVDAADPTIPALLDRIDHPDARTLLAFAVPDAVADEAKSGDLVVVMGAGDIWTIERSILDALARRRGGR